MKVIRKVILLTVAATTVSACSSTTSMFGDTDLQISGTEEGIQSFFDGVVGTAIAGKQIENIPTDTPHHQLRRAQNMQRTLRVIKPTKKGSK